MLGLSAFIFFDFWLLGQYLAILWFWWPKLKKLVFFAQNRCFFNHVWYKIWFWVLDYHFKPQFEPGNHTSYFSFWISVPYKPKSNTKSKNDNSATFFASWSQWPVEVLLGSTNNVIWWKIMRMHIGSKICHFLLLNVAITEARKQKITRRTTGARGCSFVTSFEQFQGILN